MFFKETEWGWTFLKATETAVGGNLGGGGKDNNPICVPKEILVDFPLCIGKCWEDLSCVLYTFLSLYRIQAVHPPSQLNAFEISMPLRKQLKARGSDVAISNGTLLNYSVLLAKSTLGGY